MYHFALFPKYVPRILGKLAVIIPLLGVIYIILVPIYYGTLIAPFFQVYGLLVILLGFYLIVREIKDKNSYAIWVLISLLMMNFPEALNHFMNAKTLKSTL